jgi:hypothetical protein
MSIHLQKPALAALALGAAVLGSVPSASAEPPWNPTLFFAPYPGGIRVTVQNLRPEDTHCTYNADWIRRDFFLKGVGNNPDNFPNAKAVLDFPGVPLFRQWNVNVICQNGTSVSTQHWY